MKRTSNLRLLIWNDDKLQADHWKAIADDDGFPNTIVVTSPNIDSFVEKYLQEEPDLIVTDILHKENPVGLDLVKAIRNIDNLVPIVAVTIKPDLVFKEKYRLEDYAFCGIYPSTIFQKGLVGVTLRQALNIWHVQVPEFALAKAALHKLRQGFGKTPESELVSTIREVLLKLPYSGSINSWHAQVCAEITALLDKKGYKFMKSAFDTLVEVFQRADPFFMAGGRSRRHLSHNVQVFLLGLTILLADTDIRHSAIKDVGKRTKSVSPEDALENAVLVWACISLTHDAAYLSENMREIFGKLLSLAKIFAPAAGAEVEEPKFSEGALALWPDKHHARVTAEFWQAYSRRPPESSLIDLVSAAILRHDSRYAADQLMSAARVVDWATFLAVICDELQDWQRLPDRLPAGEEAPWRNFAIERLRVGRDSDSNEFFLQLDFVLQDYASVVREQVGTQGIGPVRERFKQILEVLKQNVISNKVWNITLSADFVSRSVRKVVEHGELRSK